MAIDVPIRCKCGKVQGRLTDVSPQTINRVACHCKFCAAYARRLAGGTEVLDEDGGTEVWNVCPPSLEITEGLEHVVCGRLTSKGAMRWYAGCCETPIANTAPKPSWPFLGVVVGGCLDPAAVPDPAQSHTGPVRARVNHTLSAEAAKRRRGTKGALFGMLAHFLPLFVKWRLRGDQKRFPFYDPKTGAPIVEPHRLEWERPAQQG